MNELDRMYDQIDLMLNWLDQGVFYDSFEGMADAPKLPPLPDVSRWDMDALEELHHALNELKCGLNDTRPEPQTLAHRARAALLKQIEAYSAALAERIVQLEDEA